MRMVLFNTYWGFLVAWLNFSSLNIMEVVEGVHVHGFSWVVGLEMNG